MLFPVLSAAIAADVFPGLAQPSAVPMDADRTVALELAAVGGAYNPEHRTFGLGTLAAAWEPASRVRLGGTVRGYAGSGCGWLGLGTCKNGGFVDATAHAAFALVDAPHTRLAAVVGAGTVLQAGLALWTSTDDGVWALDATWQPGVAVDRLGDDRLLDMAWTLPTFMPELGVTFAPGDHAHSLRAGLVGLPTLGAPVVATGLDVSWRWQHGRIGLEAGAGGGLLTGVQAHTALTAQL